MNKSTAADAGAERLDRKGYADGKGEGSGAC
jgi:hypothetical protein